ncbi:Nitrite-sensitive transcriptional repressor NsrR [hydrothermal vent metagenome]|uniref:Nitrite-sensitive transcriptional repressor NsrR n=1 Tax=hydrothermal vent metagenome TaxID=652676 RepID=A0A3B0ZKC8_9ZZZZ
MQLTLYTDYSFRVLLYLGVNRDRLCTIAEISKRCAATQNHLVKVVHNLGREGYIQTMRGRTGGIKLKKEPEEINLTDIIRCTEVNLNIAECLRENNKCHITDVCKIKNIFKEAQNQFIQTLDNYTVADLLKDKEQLTLIFGNNIIRRMDRSTGTDGI